LLLLTALIVSSCHPQKKIQRRGGYVLTKNNVRTDNSYLSTEEISGVIQQKATPGRMNLFRPGVWIYETFSKGRQSNLKKKIKEKYGTQPVILDTNLVRKSEQNIRMYLRNKGFYHPVINHRFRFKRASASVYYQIEAGKPYIISSVKYQLPDPIVSEFILKDTVNRLIKPGSIFDTYILDDERDRLSAYLRNQGYYDFSKSNIAFSADTGIGDLKTDLTYLVRKMESSSDMDDSSATSKYIPRYFIHKIFVVPDVEQSLEHRMYDTIPYIIKTDSTEQLIYFIRGAGSRIKPAALANTIQLRTGQAYRQDNVTQTYKRLISLPVVRSATINLDTPEPDTSKDTVSRWLDCVIKITRNPVSLLSIGTEGTNSAGRLGLGFNVLYQNRNIFKGAETFRLKINAGAEFQGNVPSLEKDKKLWLFNALESGAETGIDFPRLLLPFHIINPDRNQQVRTSITAGYGYESRPDYSRRVTTFAGSYQWNSSESLRHILTPLELNFVSILKDSVFQAYLNSLTDPQFIGQYNDHLLTMIRYSIIFSNQAMLKEKNPYYLRINAETSGNTFHVLDKATGKEQNDEGYYSRFGIRYAQYLRTDVDFRKYWNFTEKQLLAFRISAGIGFPYGNSDGIPFEKSFWLGGANDMRGWRLRSLGPGSYTNDTISFDRTGDLSAFANMEYRFPIYSFLNGGIFTDAGNIWLREENPDFPGGKFSLSNLGKQLALDAGLGLRFDFSFFIFRIDWAFRMKNPQYKSQWFQPEDFRLRKAVWNLGIGYPF
jgi:hypothetical protein